MSLDTHTQEVVAAWLVYQGHRSGSLSPRVVGLRRHEAAAVQRNDHAHAQEVEVGQLAVAVAARYTDGRHAHVEPQIAPYLDHR